ncbi:MAG TPA: hypothetical protein PKO38_04515 [Bacillota bacterium]|nr:hypothetical protein [Bacillota bacterium]HOB86935.1 hypothetical protein [Bacillota bacterium]HOP68581.1 hypothetical protein [Bacillota bacterium]HPT33338.1 hypothetical protein [Bacillota bacterium]HPZ63993.1 hypothetical protein [Bacillota bacterium]
MNRIRLTLALALALMAVSLLPVGGSPTAPPPPLPDPRPPAGEPEPGEKAAGEEPDSPPAEEEKIIPRPVPPSVQEEELLSQSASSPPVNQREPEAPPAKAIPAKAEAPSKEALSPIPELSGKEQIHFLLLGRDEGNPNIEIMMVVTLIKERRAYLTSISPDTPLEGKSYPLGALLRKGGSYADLIREIEALSGLKPQFYIELNLEGFVEMVGLLGGVDLTEAAAEPFDGPAIIDFLKDPGQTPASKQELVINLLVAGESIQNTRLGFTLLWTGFKNIKTNITLQDLLQLRRVTQKISPTAVVYREIP